MTDEMSASAAATPKCQWCGRVHRQICPLVKSIEYHQDGTVKRVEFSPPGDEAVPHSMTGGGMWQVPGMVWTDALGWHKRVAS